MFENIVTLKKYIFNCYPIENKIKNKEFEYRNNTFFSILSCIICKESIMTYDTIKGHKFVCKNCKQDLCNTRFIVKISNDELKNTYNNKFLMCTEIDWNPFKPYQGQKYIELRKQQYENGKWEDSKKEGEQDNEY